MTEKLFKNEPDPKEFSNNVSAVKTTNITDEDVKKTTNISEENFRTEHFRMAHLNSLDLVILLRSRGVKIENKTINNFTCDECLKSKSTVKRPFNMDQ